MLCYAVDCTLLFGILYRTRITGIRMKLILQNFPINWRMLKAIADSSAVKNSFVWLIIVPLVAKALTGINDVLTFDLFGNSVSINTTLPFSWQHLFWAACWFTVANLIYISRCPEIVKSYKTFTDFEADAKGQLQINSSLKKIVWSNDKRSLLNRIKDINKNKQPAPGIKEKFKATVVEYFWTYCSNNRLSSNGINRGRDKNDAKKLLADTLDYKAFSLFNDQVGVVSKVSNAFYFVDLQASRHNKISILLASISYGIGFYHISLIVYANILAVLSF